MPIRKETLPVRDTPIVVSAASVFVCLLITVPSVPYASPQLVRSVQLSIPLRTDRLCLVQNETNLRSCDLGGQLGGVQ